MRSLRARLILATASGTAAVLFASGALLYALIDRELRAEFDESLAAKARSLAALAEQEGRELEFEPTEAAPPEFEPSEHAEYYQLWLPGDVVFARSPSLRGASLDRIEGTNGQPAFASVRFPDGRPGRIVGVTFTPRSKTPLHRITPLTATLVVGRDTRSLRDTLGQIRAMLIGVGILAVVLSTGVLAWAVGRGLRSVKRLSRQIADVAENDLSVRIDASRLPDELVPVVDRLNDLLARLEATFQRERRFTGDVAHELRTPLAGLRAVLELALSRPRTPGSYRDSLDECLHINQHMQRMVENLLHLARADAGQLDLRRESVNLAEVVRECWKPLEERAASRALHVEWHLGDDGTVVCDGEKLRLVLGNILDNAVTYADENGHVSLSISGTDGAVVLDVSNSGCELSAEESRHIFDRFWRRDAARSRTDDGHWGLGLPLCKAIVEQLGGSIDAGGDADGTFTIMIRLPRGV